MLTLKCKIEIRNKSTNKIVSFDYVHSIEVNTSMKNLTDTATIKVPRKMQYKGKSLFDSIEKGNTVTIQMGYEEYGLQTVFTGYLIGKENSTPLVLKCENEMWNLKKIPINDVSSDDERDFDIQKFFNKYAKPKNSSAECRVNGIFAFGKVQIELNKSVSKILDEIKQKYPYVDCFFRNDTFHVVEDGQMESPERNTVIFNTQHIILDELKFEHSDDKKICVKAVSVTDENKQIVAYAPENGIETKEDKKVVKDDYEERFRYCPGYEKQADLQKHADSLYQQLKVTRMSGSFKALGIPFVRKGDVVELRDDEREERNKQKFIVESVDYTFSTDEKNCGYRQKITLGRQVE